MRPLYDILESIADDDSDVLGNYDNDTFTLSIAKCFKKVFGDFDPNPEALYLGSPAFARIEVDSNDKDAAFEATIAKLKELEKEFKKFGFKSTPTIRKKWGSVRSEDRYLTNNIEIVKRISIFKKLTCTVNFDIYVRLSDTKVSDSNSRARRAESIFALSKAPFMSETDKQVIEYLKNSKKI